MNQLKNEEIVACDYCKYLVFKKDGKVIKNKWFCKRHRPNIWDTEDEKMDEKIVKCHNCKHLIYKEEAKKDKKGRYFCPLHDYLADYKIPPPH